MNKKVIQYYVKHNYGSPYEYVANPDDAELIRRLTGQKTINSVMRELIRDLSGGNVTFEKIHQPGI